MNLLYFIVDVFARGRYTGNQLAVFPYATGVSGDEMQEIAREMHFSETTFITSQNQDNHEYRVRIFTPEHEVPFAGHPVLGTAQVIKTEILRDNTSRITLNVPAGPIVVTFVTDDAGDDGVWMRQNTPTFFQRFTSAELSPVLSLPDSAIDGRFPIEEVSTGLPFIIVPLVSRDAVRAARINRDAYFSLIAKTTAKAVYVFCSEPYHRENTLYARMFADYYGVPEDPATGSAAGCLAAYLVKNQYFSPYREEIRIEQGYEVHRPSLLICRSKYEREGISVDVGGKVIVIARGELIRS
jgi:trans-2,3-dihydro-3-hydroxyanthranilate isomerase